MINDTTFKLFLDAGLTSPDTNLLSIINNTNLSDNPHDYVRYFGSNAPAGTAQLRASSNPGTDQITFTPTDTLPAWVAATVYTLGQSVEPVTPNTYRYIVTVAGTSHATTEPTWPTTIGATVVNNTVTFKCEAKKSPTTEVKLASTSGGLAGATPGGALNLGTVILSGVANAVQINIRVTNIVTTVTDSIGNPEYTLFFNNCQENPT